MSLPLRTAVVRFFCGVVCALSLAGAAAAQSTDVGQPTPVFSGEISGRIAPRDLGDARLTRHFYGFAAAEGDLVVTVESTDFNGDVDVFTAGTLRPLLKITLYAVGSTPSRVAQSVYIRRDESLVLRVEGRTVVDADAQYRIRLTGSFRPAAGAPPPGPDSQPLEASETASTTSKGRRATSTGARIPRPAEETPARPEAAAPESAATTEAAREPASSAREPASRPTGRRSTSRSSTRAGSRRARPPARDNSENASRETPKPADAAGAEASKTPEERGAAEAPAASEAPAPRASRARTPRRGSTRRSGGRGENPRTDGEAAAAETSSAGSAAAEPSTRLVIMLKDGELFTRDMKSVRRVTVERGQIVVVETDGKVTRHPLALVQRMAIEP